jgi:hypothetical protein
LRLALDDAVKRRADAVFVGVNGVTQANLCLIADVVAKHRLPSIYGAKEYAVAFGGLMTYGVSDPYMYLPVEQPTKFELVINLKTAKALGLTIPRSLLLRADQVIE